VLQSLLVLVSACSTLATNQRLGASKSEGCVTSLDLTTPSTLYIFCLFFFDASGSVLGSERQNGSFFPVCCRPAGK
jgi:hypothetical protein